MNIFGPTRKVREGQTRSKRVDSKVIQALGDRLDALRSALRQHRQKFISFKTTGNIRPSGSLSQTLSKFLQHTVSNRMTKTIIDLFERVQVEQDKGQCVAMPLRASNFIRQPLLDVSPVEYARKGIEKSELVKLLRYLLPNPINLHLLINHVDVEEHY